MATFQGSNDVIEQPKNRSYAQGTGWSTIRTWEGERDAVFEFAKTLPATGAENIQVTDDGPTSKVQATYPDSQDTATDATQDTDNVEWELLGNDLEKKLQTHPTLDPGTTQADLENINAAIAAAQKGDAMNTGWSTKAQNIYKLVSQGVEAYITTHYVLRKTIKLARSAQVKASLSNVNKVEAPTGVPNGLFDVPTAQYNTGATIQWLKKPPQVRYLGKGKFAITQEWWGGQWSTILYSGSHSP